ncbi:DUF4288 domain-containing protein [Microbulbifer sp. SSSA008]|uniref:DUF4288 domain-containing protein n=1 Tax=Microbulbifer sp. SSSA008 TaxID=3243380 RepID=UPI004039192D
MSWYGVRSVYHFGISSKGLNIFEERVVCIRAESFKEAHSRARKEAEEYAEDNGFDMHPEQVCYKQDGDELIKNYEVLVRVVSVKPEP